LATVMMAMFIRAAAKQKELMEQAERCREDLADLRSAVNDAIEAAERSCCGCFGVGLEAPC
jgi:hypothetical protein